MRNLTAICLFVIIISTGCASEKYWYNEENTYMQARGDCRDCLYQVQQKILENSIQPNNDLADSTLTDSPAYRQQLFEECMESKGYIQEWEWDLDFEIKKGYLLINDELYNIAGN